MEFAFDFVRLIEGRSLYWVEGVEGRRRGTCRLLASAGDVEGLPVRRYDPVRTRGPLRLVDGEWFWRDDLELELMVHGDVPMSLCDAVGVVAHNRVLCQRGPVSRCPDVGRGEEVAAAILLAGAMAGRYRLPPGSLSAHERPTRLLSTGWSAIIDALDADDDGVFGDRARRKSDIDVLVSSALLQLSLGREHQAAEAAALASGAGPVRSALKRLLRARTGVRVRDPHGAALALRPGAPAGAGSRG